MNLAIGQYVYGYIPFVGDFYGVYEVVSVNDNYILVISIVSELIAGNTRHEWAMPESAITMIFDTTDLNIIKHQHPELFI